MPPAALAERETFVPTIDRDEGLEAWAHSTRLMVALGEAGIRGALMTPEGQNTYKEGFTDFRSAAEENLTTDSEHGERLKFDPVRTYDLVDGHAVDKQGTPVVKMVRNGFRAATEAAKTDKKMKIEVERVEGDIITVDIVDQLEVGEMYAVVSMDPKTALASDPEYWRNERKYREGMAVVQTYYKSSDSKLLAGAHSVKQSSMPVFRQIFARRGVNIPENESENRYIRYGIRRRVSEQEARAYGSQLVDEHKREVNPQTDVHSVTELLNRHQSTVKKYFDTYIVPLSVSRVTGKNNPTISSLASTLLTRSDLAKRYDSDEVDTLKKVADISSSITAKETSFMEEKVRYALVEELRTYLPNFIEKPTTIARDRATEPELNVEFRVLPAPDIHPMAIQFMNQRLAAHIASGVVAGRTYGGCSGAGKSYEQTLAEMGIEGGFGTQDVFGGKAKDEQENSKSKDCDFISKECPVCHTKNVKTVVTDTHIIGKCGCKVKKEE